MIRPNLWVRLHGDALEWVNLPIAIGLVEHPNDQIAYTAGDASLDPGRRRFTLGAGDRDDPGHGRLWEAT